MYLQKDLLILFKIKIYKFKILKNEKKLNSIFFNIKNKNLYQFK